MSAGRELSVVIVNGSPSGESKSAALAGLVADQIARVLPASVHRVDVYALGRGLTDARSRGEVAVDVEAELTRIENADVIIPAIPVFRGSYPGMFKHLFDLIGQYAIANTTVIPVATGGGDRHAHVLDYVLRPLFAFFQADVSPVGIYASAADFDGTLVLNNEIYGRIEMAITDITPTLERLSTAPAQTAGVS